MTKRKTLLLIHETDKKKGLYISRSTSYLSNRFLDLQELARYLQKISKPVAEVSSGQSLHLSG